MQTCRNKTVDESTAGANDATPNTNILQELAALLPSGSGQDNPHHSLSQPLYWAHCNTCTAPWHDVCDRDKSSGRSCSLTEPRHLSSAPSLWMLRRPHTPGDANSAPGISPLAQMDSWSPLVVLTTDEVPPQPFLGSC